MSATNKLLGEVQQFIKDQNYQQAINACLNIIRIDPQNPTTYVLLAISVCKNGQFIDALQQCESLMRNLKPGTEDDKVLFQVLTTGIEASNMMIEQGNQKQKKDGFEHRIRYQIILIEFLERKERWEKFEQELDSLIPILTAEDRFDELERIYYRVFMNPQLSPELKHRCGISIFTMSQFYNPKLKLTLELYEQIASLKPDSPDNALLSQKLIKDIDKRVPLSITQVKPDQIFSYLADCKTLLNLMKPLFENQDYQNEQFSASLFANNLNLFFKYLVVCSMVYEETSNDWKSLIQNLNKLITTENFKQNDQLGSESSLPLNTLIYSLVDAESHIYSLNPAQTFVTSKDRSLQDQELEKLKVTTDKKYCPHLGLSLTKALLYQAQILVGRGLTLSQEKKKLVFEQLIEKLNAIKDKTSNFNLINENIPKLKYQYYLSIDNWKAAKEVLDELDTKIDTHTNKDWIKSQRAWLSYSYLDQLASNEEEKILMLKGIVNLLKDAIQANPKNIDAQVKLGTIYYAYEKLLGINPKQDVAQWLQALKQDQSNAEIFLSLAMYYFSKEKDLTRALKCLDKVNLLRPDLEEGQLLLFIILVEQGNLDLAFANLTRFQKIQPLSVFPYFILGLRAKNNSLFTQAIEFFQSGSRFHGLWASRKEKIKNNFPQLKEALQVAENLHNYKHLDLYVRPIGILAQNDIAYWVHIADCYQKIDKNEAAMKCIMKINKDVAILLSQYQPSHNETNIINNENLSGLQNHIKSLVDKIMLPEFLSQSFTAIENFLVQNKDDKLIGELLNILLISSTVLYKHREYLSSLKFISLILSMNHDSLKSHILAEVFSVVLENMNKLLENDSKGHVDPKDIQKIKYLKATQNIFESIKNHQLPMQERFLRVYIETLKVLGEEIQNPDHIKMAIELLGNSLIQNTKITNQAYQRNMKLDLCRLYHFLWLNYDDQSNGQFKLKLMKELIQEQPENSEYWVYYGIFSENREVKDQFALNNLLCFMLKDGNFQKAFQILNSIKDLESLNALILSIQIILNARLALEQSNETLMKKEQQRKYLQDAISLGQMFLEIEKEKISMEQKDTFDIRIDIHQYLSNQINYIVTLMQFESDDKTLNTNDLQELLQDKLSENSEQYSGLLSKMQLSLKLKSVGKFSIQRLQNLIDQNLSNNNGDQFMLQIKDSLQELTLNDQEALRQFASEAYSKFCHNPSDKTAIRLILLNESLINKGIDSQENVLLKDDLEYLLSKLHYDTASKLINQSMRMMYIQDESQLLEIQEFFDLFNQYRVESLRSHLPSVEYSKIFKFYLLNQSKKNRHLFIREFKKVKFLGNRYIQLFLQNLNNQISRTKSFHDEIMNNPTDLKGYNKLIWGSILQGKQDEARKLVLVTQHKIESGFICIFSEHEKRVFDDYQCLLKSFKQLNAESIDQCKTLSSTKKTLSKLLIQICKVDSQQSDSNQQEQVKDLASSILSWISDFSGRDEVIEDQLNICQSLLQKLVLNRGYLQTFNQVGYSMLDQLKEQDSLQSIPQLFQNEFRAFLLINMANNFMNLRKLGQANSLKKEATQLLMSDKRVNIDCTYILEASFKLRAKQPQEVMKILDYVQDSSYEKEILSTLALFELKQYKNFYLGCKVLVSSLKTDLNQTLTHDSEIFKSQEIQRIKFLLGFAYHLKYQAEDIFMKARQQGIILEDDFSESDIKSFNQAYLEGKANKSLQKAKELLNVYPEIQL
eukprot:403334951